MHPVRPLLLALTLALSACQVTAVVPEPAKPAAPRTQASASPRATPAPAATPSVVPLAVVTPAVAPSGLALVAPPKLLRPTGSVAVLAGSVVVDARFAIAQGGATLLTDAGTTLVAVAGASVLSHNGGQVLSHNGGQVLSHNGSLVVAAGDGNVIVPAGAGLVAAGGMNSQNGGGLVAAGGLNYGLLQAAASAEPQPAPGTELPAAGMIVSIVDLRSGKQIALGQDAAGKPVYEVYTNAKGAFELYVPAELQGTVRVDARVPGASDPRLAYAVLVPPGGQPATIDEDTALVTRFLIDSWRGRMTQLMVKLVQDPPLADDAILKGLYAGAGDENLIAIQAVLGPLLGELRTALKGAGLKDAVAIDKAAARVAGAVLGHADLPGVRSRPILVPGITVNEDPVLDVFKAIVAVAREKAAAQMASAEQAGGSAAFLRSLPFQAAAGRILRPVDVPAYVVAEALSDEQDIQKLAAVPYFQALGISKSEALNLFYQLYAANSAAAEHFAYLLVSDPGVKADVLGAIAGN